MSSVAAEEQTGTTSSRGQGMSQMDYNPFTANLRVTEDEITSLQHRRADLVEQVAWATGFNPEREVHEIARLHSEIEERGTQLSRLDGVISELDATSRELASQTPDLERDAHLGMRVFRVFTTEYDRAKTRLTAHKQKLVRHRGLVDAAGEERHKIVNQVAELTNQVTEKEQALARFRDFRRVETEKEIAKVDGELALLDHERERLKARSADVDRAVQAPLAELHKYESQIEHHESTTSTLRSDLSRLERDLAEAEFIDDQLSRAANSYERAKLHDKCEREFGDGSPRNVKRTIRSQMSPLSRSVDQHERQIERTRRDMAKTEERIKKLAALAARDIRELIIDGNNCCYQGTDFIGLAALVPMIANLTQRCDATVVFDASIRGLLGFSDDDLHTALPAAKIHVVQSGRQADETVLDAATEATAWVVSNDRFGDYRDKRCVKEGRIIRHEILSGRILVHDLGVNEPIDVR